MNRWIPDLACKGWKVSGERCSTLSESIAKGNPVTPQAGTSAGHSQAFTLLEVVLAVVIATGMMAVVFYFYHQAAELRSQILQESARITAARLILERLTSELRTALPGTDLHPGLWGASNHLEFVRMDAPVTTSPIEPTNNLPRALLSTIKKVQYRLSHLAEETNTAALLRTEEVAMNSMESSMTNEIATALESEPASKGLLLTKDFQFVNFRFWNGAAWQNSWSADSLPLGIEIKLGVEACPADVVPEEYPYEQFVRIISLPLAAPPLPSRELTPPEASLPPRLLRLALQAHSSAKMILKKHRIRMEDAL